MLTHDDFLTGRWRGVIAGGGRRRLLDAIGHLLHEGKRLAQSFELALEGKGEEWRLLGPARDRRDRHREQAGNHQREQQHRRRRGHRVWKAQALQRVGHRRQYQRQHDSAGRWNEEVARHVADRGNRTHRQHDQRTSDGRAAAEMDGRISDGFGLDHQPLPRDEMKRSASAVVASSAQRRLGCAGRSDAMPMFKRADAEIHYEVHGRGFPILLYAPGGLRSQLAYWKASPADPTQPAAWMNPMIALADRFTVVGMDQRNAGQSRGAVKADHGWHTYAG